MKEKTRSILLLKINFQGKKTSCQEKTTIPYLKQKMNVLSYLMILIEE